MTFRNLAKGLLVGNAGPALINLGLLDIDPWRQMFHLLVCAALVWVIWGQNPGRDSAP